jgi:hypothetical protein
MWVANSQRTAFGKWVHCISNCSIISLLKGCHLDVVRGPSTPHDPESDAGRSLSSWQGTQAGKVKEEGRS